MTLSENTVPDGHAPWRWLFNTEAFIGLRDKKPEYQDLVCDGVKLGDVAVVDGVSGWRAPFGGIDWRRDFWRPEMIHQAICDHDFGDLREIRCKPTVINRNEPATLNALHCAGWTVAGVDLNYVIPLISVETWGRLLPRQTVHSVNKAAEVGLRVATADNDDAWRWCYDLLDANRRAKGRVLSLDFDYVLALREFGDLVRMFAVIDRGERLVAAALVYRVAKEIDMVQWHGDLPEHGLGFSPMPCLVAAYVRDADETGAVFVDLGISSVDGVPDAGLCRAKRSWGAIMSQRLILKR